jgi:hypothetical protein
MKELYDNRDAIPLLTKLLKPLLSSNFTKGDMLKEIERLEGKSLTIDFAYPVEFQHELNRLGIDNRFFVWSYEDSNFGKPLNLLERYFQSFCDSLLS